MEYKYDADADILSIEISDKPIDYAQEMGDVVVHFSKSNQPALLEILNSKAFLRKSFQAIPEKIRQRVVNSR